MRLGVGQRLDERIGQLAHLTVDDYRVQSLLAAEMLVDDRLADLRVRGDLLDTHRLEPLGCEQRSPHADELFAALQRRHSCSIGHELQCSGRGA